MESLTITRSSDAIALLVIALLTEALPLGGLVLAIRKGAALGVRWGCVVLAVLFAALWAWLIGIVTSEFVALGVSDTAIEVRFPFPRGPVTVGPSTVKSITVVQNRRPNRRLWALQLEIDDGRSLVSAPAGTIGPVIDAAERLQKLTGRDLSWGIRTGRGSAVETAAESEVRE